MLNLNTEKRNWISTRVAKVITEYLYDFGVPDKLAREAGDRAGAHAVLTVSQVLEDARMAKRYE